MTEIGYPQAGKELTDATWRDLFGRESGIVNDYTGTSYGLVLSTSSDVATLGSASQDSYAKVAGFGHTIPQSAHQGVTIPPVTGSMTQRTDVIALRYDPAYTGDPGPVRLVVVPGDGTPALPLLDTTPPGAQLEPLWAVTRRAGTALSQSSMVSLRRWAGGPSSYLPAGATLPSSAPLGSTLTLGTDPYVRVLSATNQQPVWHSVMSAVDARILAATRRSAHVGAFWGSTSGYGPWWVLDGAWNVAPGSALRVENVIKGHVYLVSCTFTTVAAHLLSGILARMGLYVSPGQPTARPGPGGGPIMQQSGVVSAHNPTAFEQTMPTTLLQRWQAPADGAFWFYPVFATNYTNGFAIKNEFGSPYTEITDLGAMTSGLFAQAGG